MNDEADRPAHALSLPAQPQAMVPAGYAEKAMASLMQLHSELMDEKERRVDLYRRLMDREQALAELRMYVKLLEEKLGKGSPVATPTGARTPPRPPPGPVERPLWRAERVDAAAEATVEAPLPAPIPIERATRSAAPPKPPQPPKASTAAGARRSPLPTDGWKTW